MLNEWSDRPPPKPRRRFFASAEFWAGVFTLFVITALIVGFLEPFL